jgi:hypothetical protein
MNEEKNLQQRLNQLVGEVELIRGPDIGKRRKEISNWANTQLGKVNKFRETTSIPPLDAVERTLSQLADHDNICPRAYDGCGVAADGDVFKSTCDGNYENCMIYKY